MVDYGFDFGSNIDLHMTKIGCGGIEISINNGPR